MKAPFLGLTAAPCEDHQAPAGTDSATATRTATIYEIIDPRTGQIVYVGQTVNLPRRIKEHLKLRSGVASAAPLAAMLAANVTPSFRQVATVAATEAPFHEATHIARRLAEGHPLTNPPHETNLAKKRAHLARPIFTKDQWSKLE